MEKETMELITLSISSGGILFSAIAAYAALKSAKVSSDQFNNQTERQKVLENPKVIPLTETINFPFYGIHFDWVKNRISSTNYHLDSSEFKVNLLNVGKNFALDVNIAFELVGGIDSFNYHYHNKITDYQIFLLVENFEEVALANLDDFYVNVMNVPNYADGREFDPLRVHTLQHFEPIIQAGDSISIYIPRYFIVLSNVYAVTKNSEKPLNKPKLLMSINYKNENFEISKEQYIVEFEDDSNIQGFNRNIVGNLIFKKNKLYP
ncbi:hypothetical protein ASF99_04695 [Exiguobacterium sp. Leaf187]|uniref:hypothetical protein n=1 Tax=Exiguobacterium sp. Leaf187 TaxID=1736294 RepID=UPI0006F7673A|nr:hypothetical protein [Exiguobacterium sp. Leaf187]KQS19188.1 hypothetical protein ASF99_04695 [Exiguobacterium sp. Leaf187]